MIAVQHTIPNVAVLLSWARAETRALVDRNFINKELAARSDSNADLSPDDIRDLIRGIECYRRGFFDHFIANPTAWFEATCPVSEIGNLSLCSYFYGTYKVNCEARIFPTLAELAEGAPEFKLPDTFDWNAMRGRPTVVCSRHNGPWCILEGTHRLAEIYRAWKASKSMPESVPCFVGVCETVEQWSFWRSSRPAPALHKQR